jgi:hypothetical protein
MPDTDDRMPVRRLLDEQIASEPPIPPPLLFPDVVATPLETHLAQGRRPVAVAGVVENGLVRPLDPSVHLPEQARVVIVATEST